MRRDAAALLFGFIVTIGGPALADDGGPLPKATVSRAAGYPENPHEIVIKVSRP